jgi:hypothetical protein
VSVTTSRCVPDKTDLPCLADSGKWSSNHHCRMRQDSSEEVAMRVMSWLCCFRKLCNEKLAIPVLEDCFPLQITRNIESISSARLIGSNDTIKEPYREVGAMQSH